MLGNPDIPYEKRWKSLNKLGMPYEKLWNGLGKLEIPYGKLELRIPSPAREATQPIGLQPNPPPCCWEI